MSNTLAVIGTAGRRDDAVKLTSDHWTRMQQACLEVMQKHGVTALVSGGAAWADHVAVAAAVTCPGLPVELWLPASQEDQDTAGYYHRRFSETVGFDTRAQRDGLIASGRISAHLVGGFKDRNTKVAKTASLFLACTFGDGPILKDGGTADTVSKMMARGVKGYHLDLNTGMLHWLEEAGDCFGREESKPGADAGFADKNADRAYLDDPVQPGLTGKPPRIRARGSQLVNGVRFFSPSLPHEGTKVQLLCVGVSPTQEEASGILEGAHGTQVMQTPKLLKGPLGTILPDAMDRYPRLKSSRMAYTVLTPWLLPRNRRFKPNNDEINWAAPLLHELVEETQPEAIIAFGKLAFDALVDLRISHADARGGWFTYKDTNIPVYLMETTSTYVLKPWSIDVLMTDFKEVNRMLELRAGVRKIEGELELRVIDTEDQLRELVAEWNRDNYREFSVDCEWAGAVYTDGDLRSIQFCWHPNKAVYLRFYDEHGNRYLGARTYTGGPVPAPHQRQFKLGETYTDYRAVGAILNERFSHPDVRFIGHQASADMPWMEHWLGIEVLGRFSFDTLYAMQTIDEYSPLGLDDIALRLTDFGRYDMPLVMWKRENRNLCQKVDGYGKVPDEILIPYAQLDVLVPMRAKPQLERLLENQDLTRYYRSFVLPFVTDTFHTWTTTGLPVDPELFGLTRRFMNWAYRVLLDDFRKAMSSHANEVLAARAGLDPAVVAALAATRNKEAVARLWPNPDPAVLDHWAEVDSFNIRSHTQMSRWLFGVLGLTPVKTTKNNPMGMSVMWTRVLEMKESFHKDFIPAVDKETMEIVAESDDTGLVHRLLAVSNVGNQCKGFLKEGEYTEAGELVEENGLAKFIDSTGRIRPNLGLTETSRPRTFEPNVLNLSSYHNKGVTAGLARIVETMAIPPEFDVLFGTPDERAGIAPKDLIKNRMPSIRSVVKAPEGWCGTECDYKTAEVRSLAFQSGDRALLQLILGRDLSFGLVGETPVRLFYEDNSPVAEEHRRSEFLMAICKEGSAPVPVTEDMLERNPDGSLVHPKFDMHWAVAEECQHKPREMMSESRDRGAGKVTRFCIAEGELVLTRDRGLVEIENVLGCDFLWDGVEWVRHEGVIYSGIKKVTSYQGLKATAKHKVWTEERGKVSLGEACAQSLTLVRTGSEGRCLGYNGDRNRSGFATAGREETILHGGYGLSGLRRPAGKGSAESGEGVVVEVQVPDGHILPGSLSRYAVACNCVVKGSLSSYAAALRKGYAFLLRELQGAWDQMLLPQRAGVCGLGAGEVGSGGNHGEGVRSDRQRRALRAGQPAVGNPRGKRVEQTKHDQDSPGDRPPVPEGESGSEIYGSHGAEPAALELQQGADCGARAGEHACREEKEVRTYDILNAGPRNRFTCSGVLVSNSGSYGAVGATLDRRIEAVTGIKPEPGTGQRMLDALAAAQPEATAFLNDVAEMPRRGQTLRAQSGKLRHFPVHAAELRGMPQRVRNSYLRAMGNEARNFYMQESVAATMSRACQWLNAFFRRHGMQARTAIGLYDAVLTLSPLEERFVVEAAMQTFMDTINIWCYHGRYMSYPIDSYFVYRWSRKPSEADKKQLNDRSWRNMDADREHQLMSALKTIEEAFFGAQPWIKPRLNTV